MLFSCHVPGTGINSALIIPVLLLILSYKKDGDEERDKRLGVVKVLKWSNS